MDFEEDFEDYALGEHALEEHSLEEFLQESPGAQILRAVDNHLPPLSSRELSITANCLVEDLTLLFPSIQISLWLATVGNNEAFVPSICGLQIFNSPAIGKFSAGCTRIPDSVVLNGTTKGKEWYNDMIKEITAALEQYTSALPITVGNASNSIMIFSNASFEVSPGEKQKIFTNFRLPTYSTKVTVKSKYRLKKSTFTSMGAPAPIEALEEAGNFFPKGRLSFPHSKKIKCSNTPILDWVEQCLTEELSDYCYEGIFSITSEDRLKLTIINDTSDTITIKEGEEIATLSAKF